MVWGAFSALGKLELCFVSTRMDGREYQQHLTQSLLPFLRRFRRLGLVYQQDNAGVHVSKNKRRNDLEFVPMLDWFQTKGINLLEWPSRSPDLNPIENLWGIMVRRIYQDNREYQTVNQLKEAITEAWDSVSAELLQKLADSMKNRIIQVIQRFGNVTDY
uniref:Tc1-like transposase DDE domain-containing protein n=1 Tax=Plectus sambesii TaxID=2011161 RepID=A0A914VA76_9BILA